MNYAENLEYLIVEAYVFCNFNHTLCMLDRLQRSKQHCIQISIEMVDLIPKMYRPTCAPQSFTHVGKTTKVVGFSMFRC